jgi:hypothetical protein
VPQIRSRGSWVLGLFAVTATVVAAGVATSASAAGPEFTTQTVVVRGQNGALLCMAAANPAAEASQVVLAACSPGNAAQQWRVRTQSDLPDAPFPAVPEAEARPNTFTVQNVSRGLCLGVDASSMSAYLVGQTQQILTTMQTCTGDAVQRWVGGSIFNVPGTEDPVVLENGSRRFASSPTQTPELHLQTALFSTAAGSVGLQGGLNAAFPRSAGGAFFGSTGNGIGLTSPALFCAASAADAGLENLTGDVTSSGVNTYRCAG